MCPFVIFEMKAALIIAAFYLGYKLFLSREKLLRFNRIVLLVTLCISFILPLCRITFRKTIPLPATEQVTGLTGIYAEIFEHREIISSGAITANAFPWGNLLAAIYFTGAAAMMLKILIDIVLIIRTIKSGKRISQTDGTEIVIMGKDIAPFSWMKWIFISEDDYNSLCSSHILMHEKAHIKLGHAKDMLIYNILLAFQWFNPAMWLLGRDLRSLCEYEADDAVLQNRTNIKEYQYSLIRKAAGASGNSITNSFNHSILKNRITMMSKSKSPTYRGLRVLYVIPLIAAVLTANAETKIDYKSSEKPAINAIAEEQNDDVLIEIKKENDAFAVFVNGSVSTENISTDLTKVLDSDGIINVTIKAEDDTPMGIIADIKSVLRLFPVKIIYAGESQEFESPGQIKLPEALQPDGSNSPGTDTSSDESFLRRNIIMFLVNKNGKYFIHTTLRELDTDTRICLKDIISNKENSADNPETVMTDIRKPDGSSFSYPVSKASIIFRCDRKTPYKYFRESNEFLRSVYTELRNECSENVFGKSLSNLSEAEYRTIVAAVPMRIMEADMMER